MVKEKPQNIKSPNVREAIVQKIPEFYEIISQTGRGVNRISYLLFRNSKYPKISGEI